MTDRRPQRNRVASSIATLAVIGLGLASRKFKHELPQFIGEYAGDALWALMVFLLVGIVWQKWPTLRVAVVALLISYADEISQLYHAPWIDSIRDTTLGGLVLGQGFLWSDLVCYTVGVAFGAIVEIGIWKLRLRRDRVD